MTVQELVARLTSHPAYQAGEPFEVRLLTDTDWVPLPIGGVRDEALEIEHDGWRESRIIIVLES